MENTEESTPRPEQKPKRHPVLLMWDNHIIREPDETIEPDEVRTKALELIRGRNQEAFVNLLKQDYGQARGKIRKATERVITRGLKWLYDELKQHFPEEQLISPPPQSQQEQ